MVLQGLTRQTPNFKSVEFGGVPEKPPGDFPHFSFFGIFLGLTQFSEKLPKKWVDGGVKHPHPPIFLDASHPSA
jgi:hypothetical protein